MCVLSTSSRKPLSILAFVMIIVFLWPSGAKADLTISLEGECPGEMTVSWDGAVPDRWAVLLTSRIRGPWIVPGTTCGGTVLGIVAPTLRVVFRTDEDGSGSMQGFVPNGLCGQYLQMVVLEGHPCQTSNVVQIQ